MTLTSDIRFGIEGSSARGRTLLREGDTRFCALSWGRRPPPKNYKDADKRLRGRRTTGSTGWPGATSPTTAGAAT